MLTPSAWLRKKLEDRPVPQAQLARQIRVSPSQLNRWIMDEERVPLDRLIDLACELSPEDITRVHRIKGLEELLEQLRAVCMKLARALAESGSIAGSSSGDRGDLSYRHLVRFIEQLVDAQIVSGDDERDACTFRFTSDAIFVVRAFTEAVRKGSRQFVTPETLRRHLLYPVDVITGALLGRAPANQGADPGAFAGMRDWFIADLRNGVATRDRDRRGPLCFLHDMHLLCRYGESRDAMLVYELVIKGRYRDNQLACSVAYTGNVLSSGSEDRGELFARELLRHPSLARASLRFDAYHYGDLHCTPDELAMAPIPALSNTAVHLARQLSSSYYTALAPVTAVKLMQVVSTPAVLEQITPRVRAHLVRVFRGFVTTFEASGDLERQLKDNVLPHLDQAVIETAGETT